MDASNLFVGTLVAYHDAFFVIDVTYVVNDQSLIWDGCRVGCHATISIINIL